MNPGIQVSLKKAGWVKRLLEVTTSERTFQVEYGLDENWEIRVAVDGAPVLRHPGHDSTKRLPFLLGGLRASIEVTRSSFSFRVTHFHLLVDNEVVFCEKTRQPSSV